MVAVEGLASSALRIDHASNIGLALKHLLLLQRIFHQSVGGAIEDNGRIIAASWIEVACERQHGNAMR
jgi:hypothetical protein